MSVIQFQVKISFKNWGLGCQSKSWLLDWSRFDEAMSIWQFSSSQTFRLSPSTYLMFCAGFTVVINHSYVWRRRMVKFLYEIKRAWNQRSDCSILTPFSPERISVLRAVFYILLHLAVWKLLKRSWFERIFGAKIQRSRFWYLLLKL